MLSRAESAQTLEMPVDAVVLVTDRLPNDDLYHKLKPDHQIGKLKTLRLIGDAEAPHLIAQSQCGSTGEPACAWNTPALK